MNAAKVKNFVLDTNVILHDPLAITKFGASNVIRLTISRSSSMS